MLIFRHAQWYSKTMDKQKNGFMESKVPRDGRLHMDLLRRHTLSSYPFDTKSMG